MNKAFRIVMAMALVGAIAVLAKNKVVWAGSGASRTANQSGQASLTGLVWNDADQDGVQDVGENGISNLVVNLFDGAGAVVNTAITDSNGRYRFEGVAPGNYSVGLDTLAGYVISPQDKSKDEALDSDLDKATGRTIPATLVAGENTLKWDIGLSWTGQGSAKNPGTVKPPPGEIVICENGVSSVGGASTLEVENLAPGYCIVAFLRNHAFAVGRVPDGAGKILAHITFIRIFHYGKLVHELPEEDGQMQLCYAAPPDRTVQMYFFDFYGPQLGQRTGKPSWTPLDTTIGGGSACAAAQFTGAYALMGK